MEQVRPDDYAIDQEVFEPSLIDPLEEVGDLDTAPEPETDHDTGASFETPEPDEPVVTRGRHQEIGRTYLLFHRTSMLCKECGEVRRVTDFRPLARKAVLVCGHKRGIKPS